MASGLSQSPHQRALLICAQCSICLYNLNDFLKLLVAQKPERYVPVRKHHGSKFVGSHPKVPYPLTRLN